MTNPAATSGAAGGAAAAAAIANAVKASGAIVRVENADFLDLLARQENPLVVYAPAGFLRPHQYLTSYRGFIFAAKTKSLIPLPDTADIIYAKTIWIPA